MNDQRMLLTAAQAIKLFGVSKEAIARERASGRLKAVAVIRGKGGKNGIHDLYRHGDFAGMARAGQKVVGMAGGSGFANMWKAIKELQGDVASLRHQLNLQHMQQAEHLNRYHMGRPVEVPAAPETATRTDVPEPVQ